MNINLTLFLQMISFAVFVWFTMKFVWPPIVKALEARKAAISEGLAAAERGKHDQALAQQKAKGVLKKAKAQASEIVGQAQKRSGEIIDEAKSDARAEGERILVAARAQVDQEVNHAREQLREKVAALAIAGAEKILSREIDAAAHKRVVESLVKEL